MLGIEEDADASNVEGWDRLGVSDEVGAEDMLVAGVAAASADVLDEEAELAWLRADEEMEDVMDLVRSAYWKRGSFDMPDCGK